MADPLGFISGVVATGSPVQRASPANAGAGENFADVLRQSVNDVNKAQQEATRAVEDLQTGDRADLEGVILAANKADNAFRMLQALRNRVVEAYDEIKQMRV